MVIIKLTSTSSFFLTLSQLFIYFCSQHCMKYREPQTAGLICINILGQEECCSASLQQNLEGF